MFSCFVVFFKALRTLGRGVRGFFGGSLVQTVRGTHVEGTKQLQRGETRWHVTKLFRLDGNFLGDGKLPENSPIVEAWNPGNRRNA